MPDAPVKEIIDEYVLLTYDIPAKEGKLRKTFLKQAAAIGAICYTQSCYLLPYSEVSFGLANELAQYGKAVVWISKQKDKDKAADITNKYEEHLHIRCQTIEQRFVLISEYIEIGNLFTANRMLTKTLTLLSQLAKIAETYNPPWLKPKIEELYKKMAVIYHAD